MVLGNAWESVDIFAAMGYLLSRGGNSSLGHLASLRGRELIAGGGRSLDPEAPRDSDALIKHLRFVRISGLTSDNESHNKSVYPALRADADDWQARRTAYLTARLAEGRHPDTEPGFWKDLPEIPATRLERPWPQEWLQRRIGRYWSLYAMVAGLVLGIWLLRVACIAAARAVKRWRQSGAPEADYTEDADTSDDFPPAYSPDQRS